MLIIKYYLCMRKSCTRQFESKISLRSFALSLQSIKHIIVIMEITFEEDYLRELYYEGKAHNKKYRFQPQIIKKYVRVIDLMASLNSTEDFYRYKALHYEALVGDKKDRESVRVNDQYRIEFHSEVVGNEKQITICNILELSNHYK